MLKNILPHVGALAATAIGVYGFNWLLKKFPIV